MWKDFFNFSKRERITIIALTFLIIIVQLLIWTKDSWVKFMPASMEQKYLQKKDLEAHRDSISASKPTYAAKQRSYDKKRTDVPLSLVSFNPNTADSMTLRKLGLRSYVVKNILNYRRKGGQFRKSSDFAKIYGMEPTVFASLEPLIKLETAEMVSKIARSGTESMNVTSVPMPSAARAELTSASQPNLQGDSQQASAPQSFELNTADTALLQQLKGIGSFSANRIARYRKELGGFYSLTQLSEIKGLYPETLARLLSMTKIDPTHINTLNVNKVSLEKLRAHPYLTFYQAKVIVELRKSRGQLHSIEELSAFKEFTSEDLERLKWYLSF